MEKKKKKTVFKKEKILLHLARMGEFTTETLLNALLGMGNLMLIMGKTPKRRVSYYMWKAVEKSPTVSIDFRTKAALLMMISRLKKEGLIANEKNKIVLTKKGEKFILSKRYTELEKLPKGKDILIIFDIPESPVGRRKRDWLRGELCGMGFRMLQKSVWIGSCVLPKRFIKDIYELKLDTYVHIFEIVKYGTLENGS